MSTTLPPSDSTKVDISTPIPAIPIPVPVATIEKGSSQIKDNSARESKVAGSRGIVVRALHKSASMFLYRFFEQVAFDSQTEYFSTNHQKPNEHQLGEHIEKSFCVCPVRDFNPKRFTEFSSIENVTQIFHVRDPRDMIVSQYFSFGWIHDDNKFSQAEKLRRAKVRAMPIDDYVLDLNASNIEKRYAPLLRWLDQSHQPCATILVKYETMVTNFSGWVRSVIKPFPFRWPRVTAARYAWRYCNEFKTRGEAMTHKRRITPGDHREKLQPETIQRLNDRYEPILVKLGYDI